jgi:hypothetical protein
LSLEADQDNETLVCVAPDTAKPDGTDGACPSAHAEVAEATLACPDRLPAASNASTESVYDVPQESPENV